LHFETVHEVTEPQLAALRGIAGELGLEAERQAKIKMGFAFPPADPAVFPLGEMKFRSANRAQVRTTANAKDIAAMGRWIEEARGLSDLVMVSLHAHEQAGADKEQPAEFISAFARAMIDAGADVVAGHGPHLLRGLELYKGKPIFYSLGNFIGQNELVHKIPADGYDRFRADPELKPGQVYQARTKNDRAGFPADQRYWESVVPVLRWQGRELRELSFLPISLGWKDPRHRRGRPRLAGKDEGRSTLERFAALSRPFGTTIDVAGAVASL
jgi:poly-gamma-glutamate synthesis protein (capsule biosynthesis protein)